MKTTIPILAALAIAAPAFAGERVVSSGKKTVVPVEECFRANEWQLDLFGQYSDGNAPDHAGPIQDHGWGGGVGVNYFFTNNLGIGVDASWLSTTEPSYTPLVPFATPTPNGGRTVTHNFSGSLIWRFPIHCVAPYVFAGGGVAVDGKQWAVAHGGVGFEWRIQPQKLSIFTDGRFNYYGTRFGRGDLNNFTIRTGVRIVF